MARPSLLYRTPNGDSRGCRFWAERLTVEAYDEAPWMLRACEAFGVNRKC